jgi:hypothetical protein
MFEVFILAVTVFFTVIVLSGLLLLKMFMDGDLTKKKNVVECHHEEQKR